MTEVQLLSTLIQSVPSLAIAVLVYLIMQSHTKKLIELVENNTKVMTELVSEIKTLKE